MGKWSADEETAARLHGMAAGTFPFLAKLKPTDFARLLAVSEMALGSALLLPVVSAALAGTGLTAFSAGLLGMYVRTPGMRREHSLRPSQQGTALAKDVWMLAIGLGLVADALTQRDSAGRTDAGGGEPGGGESGGGESGGGAAQRPSRRQRGCRLPGSRRPAGCVC